MSCSLQTALRTNCSLASLIQQRHGRQSTCENTWPVGSRPSLTFN